MVRVLEGESVCEANGKLEWDLKRMLTLSTVGGVCGKRKVPASLFWHLIT